MRTKCGRWVGAVAIVVMAGASQAQAAKVFFGSFNPSGNVSNAAVSAVFSNPLNTLSYQTNETFTLTLSYTSATAGGSGFDGGGVLTGFIWDMPLSVVLGIGDNPADDTTTGVLTGNDSYIVHNPSGPPPATVLANTNNYNISGNWAFSQPPSQPTGVGAAGGDYEPIVFGDEDIIGLPPDGPLDGTDFGLIPYGTGTDEISGSAAKKWIQSQVDGSATSVIFSFKVLSGTLVANDIKNGKFLFGSGLEFFLAIPGPDDSTTPVPEPGAIAAMLSLASFGLGAVVVRRRRAKKLAA